MCYREPPELDFEPIQVACLCGMNGHGKSALLDAMTWALWGEARARTQDELIHQGQTDMSVELDFSARDRRYRVSRRHSRKKGKQGATMLELQVASDGAYVPITGNSVRETESAIRELLHMDYDTFVNTAFLLQGRADMFTAATPSKRKEVLAEVLDLGYYESLASRAKERSKERDRRIADIDATIAAHSGEIEGKPRYASDLAAEEASLIALDSELGPARRALDELRAGVDRLRARRSDLEGIERRLQAAGADLASLEARAGSHSSRVTELEVLAARSAEIERGLADLKQVRATLDSLDRALAALNDLERTRAEAEKELAVLRERASSELARERAGLAELESAASRRPEIEAALAALAQDRAVAAELGRRVETERAELSALGAEAEVLESQATGLRSRMEETRTRFDLLEAGEATCPVCRQALGAEGAEHLRAEFEKEGKAAREGYATNRARAKELAGRNEATEAALAETVARATRAGQDVERRAVELERDLATSRQASEGLAPARVRVAGLETALSGADFGAELATRLTEIDARVGELGYDDDAHGAARERLVALEPYSGLHARLQEAASALPDEREALASTEAMAGRRRDEIDEGERAAADLTRDLEGLAAREAELAAKVGLTSQLDSRRGALTETIGGLRERIARCERLEAEVAERSGQRRREADERAIYDELARAFGKNGIQALVIETAIPQIGAQATELLGRLTDGRMSLRLDLAEGRRERRTGEPAEQLEIRVADEMGTRSYETFSGGESFRINFAIRIALSKLLAGRSGAPLPILFIDEGFGSQDEAGQDRLREAINSIQDDFQKILVITHIDAVKDSFPSRIEVEKTPAGSTFTVSVT